MSKTYKFFYSPDLIAVGATAQLSPVPGPKEDSQPEKMEFVQNKKKKPGENIQKEPQIIYEYLGDETIENQDTLHEMAAIDKQSQSFLTPNFEFNNDLLRTQLKLSPSDVKFVGPAWIYGGCKFETTILLNDNRYRQLGLFTDDDLDKIGDTVTRRRYREFKEAASLQILAEASFVLLPVDPTKIIEPYGVQYKTYVPYCAGFLFNTTRLIIESWTLNFGTSKNPIKYSVKKGSVKLKRSRKYNPS